MTEQQAAAKVIDIAFTELRRNRREKYAGHAVRFGFLLFAIAVFIAVTLPAKRAFDSLPGPAYATYIGSGQATGTMLILPIRGEITGHPLDQTAPPTLGDMFSGGTKNTVLAVRRALLEASKIKDLKEIVLFIESPGGAVTPADEIYSSIRAWRAQHKDIAVSAYFYQIAASGGYYVAMSADHIVAGPTAIVGSISVVMQIPNIADLAKKLGVDMTVIKSGRVKDLGNMFKEMSEEGRAILQRLADQSHVRFLNVVSAGRPSLERAKIEEIADGRILSADDALKAGLIDSIAPTFEAFLTDRAKAIVERGKIGKLSVIFASSGQQGVPEIPVSASTP